jgi:hypothetical protein
MRVEADEAHRASSSLLWERLGDEAARTTQADSCSPADGPGSCSGYNNFMLDNVRYVDH